MMSTRFSKGQKILWAVFLVSLPISSFPYFPGGVGGDTLVRPLALYPLAALLVLVTLPRLFTKPIPRTVLPLAAFALVALASTVLAHARGIDSNINVSVASRSVRMLLTLALGGAFYLTVTLTPDSEEMLRFSLRWLFVGLILALIWGSLQAVYVLKFNPAYFDFLSKMQKFVSTRRLFARRVSGMTYEPSWFAEQIAFLWMPWLFAAVISNQTVFGWRFRRLTVETMLLPWAAVILMLTYSRSGLAYFVIQLVLAFLLWPRKKRVKVRNWKILFKRVAQVGLILVILVAIAFLVGTRNNYFSRLWRFWSDEEATGTYFQYIAFSQRFAYWETAYQLFEQYPVLGIGLGNFTFYFEDALSDRPLRPTPELLRKFVPEEGHHPIIVTRNLLARILVETGLLGTATFLAFLVAILGSVGYLWMGPTVEQRFWGRAGLLGLVVFVGVAFSVDSFAIPNMWILFGLVTSAAQVYAPGVT
jgi:O-antigen ligase